MNEYIVCLDAGHFGKYNQSPCNEKYYESDMSWKLHLLLIVGVITGKGTYTIVAETDLDGTKFGKLKSGKGWISLGEKYVKKVN